MLGLGRDETAFDKGLRVEIEFPLDDRVLAAIRQRDHAARRPFAFALEATGSLEYPVLVFARGKLVEIEHGFPVGLSAFITGKRRSAPEAPDVGVILPEVVNHAVADGAVRNPLGRSGEIHGGREVRLKGGVALDHFE